MRGQSHALRLNMNLARATWGRLPRTARDGLKELTARYALSVALGDIRYIDGQWYVTHAGLLRLANRERCRGIRVLRLKELCDPVAGRWFFKAVVYKFADSKGFAGFGDADPSNVSPLVRGAEMRVAETRAVNRALRKAYGIGLCSVEELGWLSKAPNPSDDHARPNKPCIPNGPQTGQTRLRDQLCLLIRQYNLNPTLVKAYAAEYCGTQALKEARRDLVESFISHLAEWAKRDRDGLTCKLNSYAQPQEAIS